jgi:ubiquitin carboxyl-terminal hydrolase L5
VKQALLKYQASEMVYQQTAIRLLNIVPRKLDMLNCDLHMKNTAKARKKGKGGKATTSDSEAGFHFIAYVPIDGNIWKFDGLERQPQKLGALL